MFQDEAGFGRINKPKRCWCRKKIRPSVPCHHIREYRYAYGAVEPITGENFFLIMPYCSTNCMNTFLEELSKQYPQDQILLVCDGAAWHKSKTLIVPENITLLSIPPYTPEMNPIEQIWNEILSLRRVRQEAASADNFRKTGDIRTTRCIHYRFYKSACFFLSGIFFAITETSVPHSRGWYSAALFSLRYPLILTDHPVRAVPGYHLPRRFLFPAR